MSEPPSKIRKVESLETSRVKSKDAISRHDSSPPSETTDPCCYWCSRISLRERDSSSGDTVYNPLPDERKRLQELFHSDCECRRSDHAPPSSACGFCKHLNFRHLVRRVLFHNDLRLLTIFSDWYCRENPQNGCQLCEYIASCGTSETEVGLEMRYYGRQRFCFNLHGADNEDDHICHLQGSVQQLQQHVNWEQIRGWLSEKYRKEGKLPVNFRVIDVKRNCIVAPDYPVDYVALSYVWGNSSQKEEPFQASMRNIEDLEIEGSLSGAPLPRTITDAMEVCRQLDQKYLWVDRLCIIQDDESKHGQIQHMDSIFGSSEFTIIALSGKHANDGLPGVSKPRTSHRLKILEWQGITLTDQFPCIHTLVQSSYWAQRGWTFQEEFCSRDNLYFTEYGAYHSQRELYTIHAECFAKDTEEPTQFFEFPYSVKSYAARSFTDPGDLVRAFIGVLNREFGHDHHFGNAAPRSQYSTTTFYEWIHWQPVDWEYEARQPPKDFSTESISQSQPHKNDIFPSWSWTSAQGGVLFYQEFYPVALWASPAAHESEKESGVEWLSRRREADNLRRITAEGGLMIKSEFPIQLTSGDYLIQNITTASSTLFEQADRDEACKKLGRVLSFTQVASLHLESLDNRLCHEGRPTFKVISSAGECIGGIWLPTLSLEYSFNKDGSLKEEKFEFMALSTRSWSFPLDSEVKSILNCVGLDHSEDSAILNVMLIWHAKGSKVARRLGIGHVLQNEWFEERPILKTIILE